MEGKSMSIPTSLMTGPGRDAQSLERDCRSTGEHLKGSAKEFQPPLDSKLILWGGRGGRVCSLASSMQTQVAWGYKQEGSEMWVHLQDCDLEES